MKVSRYYMALRSVARDPISVLNRPSRSSVYGVLWAGFITFMVVGPWLGGGYLFGTDWPGPRRFDFPTGISSSAPLQALLAAVAVVVQAELVGKLLVILILFGAALGAFLAAPADGFVARAGSALLYSMNPFMYGRLEYGQLYLLAAYALLPWVANRILVALRRLTLKDAAWAAVGLTLIGILSPHALLMTSVLAAVLGAIVLASCRDAARIRRLAATLSGIAGGTAVLSSFWLIPVIAGRGYEGGLIGRASQADLRAFAAVPDTALGLVPNLLGLYGFWAENSGRFTSMKFFVPGWPLALVLVLLVCTIGAASALRRRSDPAAQWVAALIVTAIIALALEIGVSNQATGQLVNWLDGHLPVYRGMRDAGKWAVILAFAYSQLFAVGVAALRGWSARLPVVQPRAELVGGIVGAVLLAAPLYYGNGLLYGAHGTIQPSDYPAGWYAADRQLSSDQHAGRALFLPWHEYMSYSFVKNQNNVIASPAPTFFSVPILSSADPEVAGVAPPRDFDQTAIRQLIASGRDGSWQSVLPRLRVDYILVAHELDWQGYDYLNVTPGIALVGDYGSIDLYQVLATTVCRQPLSTIYEA